MTPYLGMGPLPSYLSQSPRTADLGVRMFLPVLGGEGEVVGGLVGGDC